MSYKYLYLFLVLMSNIINSDKYNPYQQKFFDILNKF